MPHKPTQPRPEVNAEVFKAPQSQRPEKPRTELGDSATPKSFAHNRVAPAMEPDETTQKSPRSPPTPQPRPRGGWHKAACLTCRKKKVKCSGTAPCDHCSKRGLECVLESSRRRAYSERRVQALESRLAYYESLPSPPRDQQPSTRVRDVEDQSGDSNQSNASRTPRGEPIEGHDDYSIKNPLVISPPKFLTDPRGRRRFLGPSSTWAYSRHVISLLKEQSQSQDYSELPRGVDGLAFPLDLPQTKLPEQPVDPRSLPPLNFAIYLTNTVKFHIGQIYHIFDDSVYMANLFSLYNDGDVKEMTSARRLSLSQYFFTMALGKALLHRGSSRSSPFGKDFFVRGMTFLPDVSSLHDDPVMAIEVCCSIALYLQSVDHRNNAFVYLGIALRIALSHGIHHDLIDDDHCQASNDRQRSAWWTLYILDRKFSYMMGAPSQINDDAITVGLPGSPYHPTHRIAATDIHVKLSRLIGRVVDTVYAVDGKLPVSFLRIMQSTLRELAQVAEQLTNCSALNFEGPGPADRISGTLSLCYHQCIILATRPLLVCLLRERLEHATTRAASRELTEPMKVLLRTSCDSANKSLHILKSLQAQDLLELFLPFDLEHAFSATFVLILTSALYPFPDAVDPEWMDNAWTILEGLSESGHVSANFRYGEAKQLHGMLRQVVRPDEAGTPEGGAAEYSATQLVDDYEIGGGVEAVEGLSATDMIAVAELMSRQPFVDIDAGMLEGDWLWEQNFGDSRGTAFPASEPSSQPE